VRRVTISLTGVVQKEVDVREFVAAPCTTDRYFLGESCRWDEVRQELCWIDIDPSGGQFLRASADGPTVTVVCRYDSNPPITTFAPHEHRERGWVVALAHSVALLGEDGTISPLAALGADDRAEDRTNDGGADPWGRFLTGTMALADSPGTGRLYQYHPESGVETLLGGITASNGFAWSPDRRTFYYVDSGPGLVYAYDVARRGALSRPRVFAAFDVPREGAPDGLCIDDEGCIWVAVWGGAEVRRYAPTGEQCARVALATSQPTSCALGGPGRSTLYITTAREDMTPDQLAREPDAGRLFCVEVESRGAALLPFRTSLLDQWSDAGAVQRE
jgi:sugar lactone lactonase YvrE